MSDERSFDVAVVGAGPAGLSAAVAAAGRGLRVAVVDAGAQTGGQYWRHPDEAYPQGEESAGHHDWGTFLRARARWRELVAGGSLVHVPNAQVWYVQGDEDRFELHLTATTAFHDEPPRRVAASTLILAPGGYDRQLPVPGWDLPGVMAAGGAQALLKGHRTLAGRRAVVAGTGPFLLPVAVGLAEAGAEVVAVCEANPLTGWLRRPLAAAGVPSKAREAVEYAVALTRHRIPVRTRTVVSAIHGERSVESVTLSRLDRGGRLSTSRRLHVDLVATGWGFTPSLELVAALGARTRMDVDGSLVAVVDDDQRSTRPGVLVAGEATGVGGALLAAAEGELAGIVAAADRGRSADARHVRRLKRSIRRLRRFAHAMHTAHPVPRHWRDWLTAETVVCRCEEVSYGRICAAHDELGANDVRTVKLMARPGMGWCQGRVCGFATADLAARMAGREVCADDLRSVAKQSLTAPVALADLAES